MGVHVASRLQRPRHAHGLDRRRQQRRPATGPRRSSAPISGMAPRARIASYKALWSTQAGRHRERLHGPTSSQAIDQAVADGVDVINYSISGTLDELPRPGAGLVPLRRGRGRIRRRLGRQQRPDDRHRRSSRPVADDGRGRHAQPQRQRLGHARQRRDVQRRLGCGRGRTGPLDRLDGGRSPARTRRGRALLLGGGEWRNSGAGSRRRSRQDRVCDRGANAR